MKRPLRATIPEGSVWELWLEDIDCNPVHRVTLLVLAVADNGQPRCLTLESLTPKVWPPGEVGDRWGLACFFEPTARRLS